MYLFGTKEDEYTELFKENIELMNELEWLEDAEDTYLWLLQIVRYEKEESDRYIERLKYEIDNYKYTNGYGVY